MHTPVSWAMSRMEWVQSRHLRYIHLHCFVTGCLHHKVAWLDRVGLVGNKTTTIVWVGIASQISLRTSNSSCLLPDSWSGVGFYAFSFTSRVRWVIIWWWWLSWALGAGPAIFHAEISEFFIKGSKSGWIGRTWVCSLQTSIRHADWEWLWWMGRGALGLSFYTCHVHCIFPFHLTCPYRCQLFVHVGHVGIPKRATVDNHTIYLFFFRWVWISVVVCAMMKFPISLNEWESQQNIFQSTTPSQQVCHPQTQRVPSG